MRPTVTIASLVAVCSLSGLAVARGPTDIPRPERPSLERVRPQVFRVKGDFDARPSAQSQRDADKRDASREGAASATSKPAIQRASAIPGSKLNGLRARGEMVDRASPAPTSNQAAPPAGGNDGSKGSGASAMMKSKIDAKISCPPGSESCGSGPRQVVHEKAQAAQDKQASKGGSQATTAGTDAVAFSRTMSATTTAKDKVMSKTKVNSQFIVKLLCSRMAADFCAG